MRALHLIRLCVIFTLLPAGLLPAAQLSPDADYADYPAVVAAPNGDLFAAWVAYDQKGADQVRLRRYANGRWEDPVTVTPAPGDYFKAALAIDRRGTVWVTWAAQVNGNFDLYARTWTKGKWSAVERLTEDPQPDFQHAMASDSDGNLYLCWQSFRTGDSNIYLKVHDGKAWSKDIAITTHEAGDWQPAIAVDHGGRVHIVYDTYRHGDYDVFLRIYDHGKLSPEIPIASTDKFEGRATVACDTAGRAWIAWDEQGSNWGLDRPFWNRESTKGEWGPAPVWDLGDGVSSRVSIRFSQRIGVAVYQNGNLWTPKGRLDDALPADLAKSFEIPHLTMDGKGVPWMFFRRWTTAKKGGGRPRGWNIYATSYRGDRWTAPVKLENSTGSNDQRVAAVADAAGKFWIVYPADERLSQKGAIENVAGRHGKVYVSPLETTASTPAELTAAVLPPSRPYRRTAPEDRRHPIAQGEKRYQLYWGDMHRHTEISGDGGYDGTLWDLYRYAIDVAELDYVASTDHFFGGPGANGELHTYDWWRTQKLADLFHSRGKFMPLFGYERSLSWPYGHRNIISLRRGSTALPETLDNSPESVRQPEEMRLWTAIRGQDVITIPHTLATGHGTNWAYNDPVLEPLMEIYQGCRMSYETKGGLRVADKGDHEEGYASRALDKGYKVGFISSSDHRSTHISYAAVYAEAPTREAIFRGLQQRHAYAATDNIVVDVRLGDAILGDVTTTDRLPELRVMARGTAPIHQVEIIRGGKHIYQSPPTGREVSFTFRDADAPAGESYYYVRLQQEDGQMAWVSPIWVKYQPR